MTQSQAGGAEMQEAGLPRAPRWPGEAPQFQWLADPWKITTDISALAPIRDVSGSDLGRWIERLESAGVAAHRHNSPDLCAQLKAALRRPIDTALCGVLDVDPNACLNSALAARYPFELAAGMLLAGRLTDAKRIRIITDARVPANWLVPLQRACDAMNIRLERIINDYPQADPTLLLYTMLSRRLRPGRLPSDQGALLLDSAAAIAVGRFALFEEPMHAVPVAIRDHLLDRSAYAIAPLGMTLKQIMSRLDLAWQERILRAGNLLRDLRVPLDLTIGSGELIFHSAAPSPAVIPQACIRCGWCVDACPTNVHPAPALEAAQRRDLDLAESAGVEACIECGICSYVCPSHLPLMPAARTMKQAMTEGMRANQEPAVPGGTISR